MKATKHLVGIGLAVGLLAAGTPSAFAQGGWSYPYPVQNSYGNSYYRQDARSGYTYGYSNRYDQIEELQEHIQNDRARMNEAIRCGNDAEAGRQAADLAGDERALRDLRYGQDAGYYNRPVYNRRWSGWSFRFGWR